ncbi:MAG: DUF87 domain-containing protein [Planctomycetes bacterium]|nr:DUF87 domain-containing protein [Planctomycetota bacterium]
MEPIYEKLGVFYLGGVNEPGTGTRRNEPVLYDAKDLTTHAVIVGMTGSGKTGLGLVMLEEAAIDGIPAIVIDPKGDLGNLLLAFPDLAPQSFRPWIDADEAARNGRTPDQHAAATADLWKRGLAAWNQEPSRVAKFRDAVDIAIYTPGSRAGIPLCVLKTFTAPPFEVQDDADAMRERVQSTVSGLLSLLGTDADPIRSREHILLSNVLYAEWAQGRDVDLAGLIHGVQTPPFQRIGVLDLESFYPAKDRFLLAMQINNLLASPGFQAWMDGEPLDIQRLLWTPEGKPRVSILSIAHMQDAERMFFVTLLLNQVVAWMRQQGGTSSLRAMLYMDEVFGYLPPTAMPPSKLPMLTLLKQARAFGLGVVLATQNPVDLDYKALSNAGTWFLGRLQTERDKLRVLDGLEGASAASGRVFDRARTEAILSGLGPRVFLMNNAHRDAPVLFETRWALSYLRGPLTRGQIKQLMDVRRGIAPVASPAAAPSGYGLPAGSPWAAAAPAAAVVVVASPSVPSRTAITVAVSAPVPAPAPSGGTRPILPPDIVQVYVKAQPGTGRIVYHPALLGLVRIHYASTKPLVDQWAKEAIVAPLTDDLGSPWEESEVLESSDDLVSPQPDASASFAALPSPASQSRSYAAWSKDLAAWIYRSCELTLRSCGALGLTSRPNESEGDFLVRVHQAARERRDLEVQKLRQKYAAKVATAEHKLRTANERVAREASQAKQAKVQTAMSFGSAMLGALFGSRKLLSAGNIGKATSAARGVGRSAQQSEDVDRAEESLQVVQQQLTGLQTQIESEVEALRAKWDDASLVVDSVDVTPKKSDIGVERVALAWLPHRVGADGVAVAAWKRPE